MNYVYKTTKHIPIKELDNLYGDNGWALYLKDLNGLQKALENSLYVLTVWDNDKLVGLIRVVGDGFSIIYIQDILLLQDYQRKGIGTILMTKVLDKYKHVRQKTLLTDDSDKTIKFYESLGFKQPNESNCIAFVRHDI